MRKSNSFIGLIPCAGKGERVGFPYPKELFPDFRKDSYCPIFMDVFSHMAKIVNEFVIIVDDQRDLLIKYLKKNCPKNINVYFILQKESISLPHAILQAFPLIKDKNVLFGMPDTIIINNNCFEKIYEVLLNNNYDLICGCFKTNMPEKYGMVEFKNDTGQINRFIDKPINYMKSEWMWGILAWTSKFTMMLKKDFCFENYNLTNDTMNIFAKKSKAFGVKIGESSYYDFGTRNEIIDFIKKEVR